MEQAKPSVVVWFDRLFWLSFLLFCIEEFMKFQGLVNPQARWWLMGAGPMVMIAFALWFFASVRRSGKALLCIAAIALIRIPVPFRVRGTLDFVWPQTVGGLLHVAASMALLAALALMLTPAATAWRRRSQDRLLEIFE